MEIKRLTPATRMVYRALIRKGAGWLPGMAKEYDVDEDTMWSVYLDYAMMSARVTLNGAVDFKLSATGDKATTIEKQFRAYLNTGNADMVWQLEKQIKEMDKPADPDLAPDFDKEKASPEA